MTAAVRWWRVEVYSPDFARWMLWADQLAGEQAVADERRNAREAGWAKTRRVPERVR